MPCGAEAYAVYEQTGRPAVSVHRYGKGKAYYVAAETDSELLRWLLRGLETEIGLQPALRVPHGVQARQIAENQRFYVNTTAKPVSIPLAQGGRGVLTERRYDRTLDLGAYESELIVAEKA